MKKRKKKPSECQKKVKSVKCPGKVQLLYEEGAPVFVCDTCGDRNETWKIFYSQYLGLFSTKSNWDNPKDKISCILGFFCYKYKEQYSTNYVFVPKNPNPYSSKECRDANALLAAFEGNAHEVRRYIHWLFSKVIKRSTKIVSFGYLTTPALIRRYKLIVREKNSTTRFTFLPQKYLDWCKENVGGIFGSYALKTMNDLGSLLQLVKSYPEVYSDDTMEKIAIEGAVKAGLVKNGALIMEK